MNFEEVKHIVIDFNNITYYCIDVKQVEDTTYLLLESCLYGEEEPHILFDLTKEEVKGYCYNGLDDVINDPESELIGVSCKTFKFIVK